MSWFHKIALIVRGGEGDTVISYGPNLYLLRQGDDSQNTQNIIQEISEDLGVPGEPFRELHDLIEYIRETRQDILYGYVHQGHLFLSDDDFVHGPQSDLLKKVVKQLNLDGVTYEDSEGGFLETLSSEELKPGYPDFVYHGTSSKFALDIVRQGLIPGVSEYNFPKVHHKDIVFVTSKLTKADFHAKRTASVQGGMPVIIQFEVPDKSKFVPDYDVEFNTVNYGKTYPNIHMIKEDYHGNIDMDALKLSRRFGILGYRGRIPGSFVTNLLLLMGLYDYHIPSSIPHYSGTIKPGFWELSVEDYVSVTLEQLAEAEEHGDPYAAFREEEDVENDEPEEDDVGVVGNDDEGEKGEEVKIGTSEDHNGLQKSASITYQIDTSRS